MLFTEFASRPLTAFAALLFVSCGIPFWYLRIRLGMTCGRCDADPIQDSVVLVDAEEGLEARHGNENGIPTASVELATFTTAVRVVASKAAEKAATTLRRERGDDVEALLSKPSAT